MPSLVPETTIINDSIPVAVPRFMVVPGHFTPEDNITRLSSTCFISLNGSSFIEISLPYPGDWGQVAFGNGVFVTIDKTNKKSAVTQFGTSWTLGDLPLDFIWTEDSNYLRPCTFTNNKFIIFSYSGRYFIESSDGLNWIFKNTNLTNMSSIWYGINNVTYGNGKYVAASQTGTSYNAGGIIVSEDNGTTWRYTQIIDPSSPRCWSHCIFANNKFVMIENGGLGATSGAATSTDGVNWAFSTMPSRQGWCQLLFDDKNRVYYALAYTAIGTSTPSDSTVAISSDGLNWSVDKSPVGLNCLSMAINDGLVILGKYSPVTNSSVAVRLTTNSYQIKEIATTPSIGFNFFIAANDNKSPSPSPAPTPSPTPEPDFDFNYKKLGERCAVSGDGTTLVGVQSSDNSDQVYVYKYGNGSWVYFQTLRHIGDTINIYQQMSCDITTTGNKIIIGYSKGNVCKLYVFSLGTNTDGAPTYNIDQILEPSKFVNNISDYGFSCSLSESGDRILVSLPKLAFPQQDVPNDAENAGYLYYYKLSNDKWILDRDIRVAEPLPDDYLGAITSCDFSGRNSIAIGGIRNRNKVALFDLTAPAFLNPDNQGANDRFTDSMIISDDGLLLVVSAPTRIQDSGNVYIYKRPIGTPIYQYTILSSADSSSNDRFGSSLAFNSTYDILFVGSENADDKGAIYVFRKSDDLWSQTQKLSTISSYQNKLGSSLGVSSDNAYLYSGAPAESPSGAVYVYKLINGEFTFNQSLVPPDLNVSSKSNFGIVLNSALSPNNDYFGIVFIGAPNKADNTGSVYIFGMLTTLVNTHQYISTIDPPPGIQYSLFGSSITSSKDGRDLFIGAPGEDGNLGSVYVYAYQDSTRTWRFDYKLSPNLLGFFGHSLSVSGDGNFLYVGAPYTDWNMRKNTGVVYVYKKSFYNNQTRFVLYNIIDSGRGDNDEYFGSSIAPINNGVGLIVGAPGSLNDRGTAFIFNQSEYFTKIITRQDLIANANFGSVIAGDDDGHRLLFSAPGNRISGSIFYYKRESATWVKKQEILPTISSRPSDKQFGISVDCDQYVLAMVAGYPSYTTTMSNSGVAVVFENISDTWALAHQIYPEDPQMDGLFGASVAMSGDSYMISVGATGGVNSVGTTTGAIYVFYAGTGSYSQIAKFAPNDLSLYSEFGKSCSMTRDGLRLIVGAPNCEVNLSLNVGAVYVYELVSGQWAFRQRLLSNMSQIINVYMPFRFGNIVKFGSHGQIAVAASQATINDVQLAGDIFVYRNDSMNILTLEAHITVPFEALNGFPISPNFGLSISISEDEKTIIVGVPGDLPNGSILRYDYVNNMWILRSKYTSTLLSNDSALGASSFITADKNFILAGAIKANPNGVLVAFSAD